MHNGVELRCCHDAFVLCALDLVLVNVLKYTGEIAILVVGYDREYEVISSKN